MRNDVFRFLFSEADQKRINPGISMTEMPYAANPNINQPYPQSMKLNFTVSDPAGGAPFLLPLIPGNLIFIADLSPGKSFPTADQLNKSQFHQWPTTGTIVVHSHDKRLMKTIQSLQLDLEIFPNRIWYSKVQLTEEFLFETLPNICYADVCLGKGKISRTAGDAWKRQVIAHFLQGKYSARLKFSSSKPEDDDVEKYMTMMPRVIMNSAGQVELTVSAALYQSARDGYDKQFPSAPTGVDKNSPHHPMNGGVPAYLLYRTVRNYMLNTGPISNHILSDQNAPVHIPIRFTRTWKPVPECSVHFPSQVVKVRDSLGQLLLSQRMPSHGMIYFKLPTGSIPDETFNVSIDSSLQHEKELRLLYGNTSNAWIDLSTESNQVLQYNFNDSPNPHVIVRRRLGQEMLMEARINREYEDACTYFSLRRTIRALIDHRITGGRLIYERKKTQQDTVNLIQAALGTNGLLVIKNRPDPMGDIRGEASKLLLVLESMFNQPAPAQILNPPSNHQPISKGRMAYYLWQSIQEMFTDEESKWNFPDSCVGRGAPGAMNALDLADYHVTTPSYKPEEILSNLEPGALLQFWTKTQGFQDLINRKKQKVTMTGHSLVFVRYSYNNAGKLDGIIVIDQTATTKKDTKCTISGTAPNRVLSWDTYKPEVWIAANWRE
nr:hypothetical protein [Neobacillus sp. Marseille-Q6967]